MATATLQDGQPFTLNYNFQGDYSGSGEGFDRPDVVGPVQYGSAPANFLNLATFQVSLHLRQHNRDDRQGDSNCLAGSRHFGNLGRNYLLGPAFKEFNFSVFKNAADHRTGKSAIARRVLQPLSTIPTSPIQSCPTLSLIPA